MLLGLLATPVLAAPTPDNLDITQIVQSHPDMPARGTRMDAVRQQLGNPSATRAAVGDPPITRWVYDAFVVYFEGERVLHSVIPKGSRD